MSANVNPQKKVDLPPKGRRNADPITDAPGSHPIETGIGAAALGAASGLAAGAVTGPVGAAIGAAVGAIAGGYAGKRVGEMIDPTTDDHWLRENFATRPYVRQGDTFEKYQPAYRYGAEAESRYGTDDFETIEGELESDWPNRTKDPLRWGGHAYEMRSRTRMNVPHRSAAHETSRKPATTTLRTDAKPGNALSAAKPALRRRAAVFRFGDIRGKHAAGRREAGPRRDRGFSLLQAGLAEDRVFALRLRFSSSNLTSLVSSRVEIGRRAEGDSGEFHSPRVTWPVPW